MRDEYQRWHAFLRLMRPCLLSPSTRGGMLTWNSFKATYGAWMPVLLVRDGVAPMASRLTRMGLRAPMDATTRF